MRFGPNFRAMSFLRWISPDIPCAFDRRYVSGPVHEEDGGDSFRARVAWIGLGMTKSGLFQTKIISVAKPRVQEHASQ